jgi:hypothetical protein
MRKQKGREKKQRKGVSRRDFIKTSATAGTMTVAGIAGVRAVGAELENSMRPGASGSEPDPMTQGQASAREQTFPRVNRRAILFAIGDTLIPSAPGDPGYKDLERYGITEEINRRLEEFPDADLELLNRSSAGSFGSSFTQLPPDRRADYFNRILQASGFNDDTLQKKLKEVYSHVREIVFTVYYQNFPEDRWPSDANSVPLGGPDPDHQITNPSTPGIVTGWDQAGYPGPLTWVEEERRRNYFKKIRWQQ